MYIGKDIPYTSPMDPYGFEGRSGKLDPRKTLNNGWFSHLNKYFLLSPGKKEMDPEVLEKYPHFLRVQLFVSWRYVTLPSIIWLFEKTLIFLMRAGLKRILSMDT